MRHPLSLSIVATALSVALAAPAQAEDAAARFNATVNPIGAWSYGWASQAGASFTPFLTHVTPPNGSNVWSAANGASLSQSCGGYYADGIVQPSGTLALRPAPGGQVTALRWTAPAAGAYHLNARFKGLGAAPNARFPANLAGTQADARFGTALAGAGDVNGDGFDDLIVAEPFYDNVQTSEGRVRLYLGTALGISGSPAWSYESNQAGASLGISVAAAGDVNNDGYDDVIVGVHGWDTPAFPTAHVNAGAAFVFYGSASGLPAAPSWIAQASVDNDLFGTSVASAGDVNHDGYSDIVVGAPYADNGQVDEGRAFLWLGGPGGLGAFGTYANADWRFEGNQASARVGESVASAGDINGDGYDDVIVGAPLFDNGQTDEGRAFLFRGAATGLATVTTWAAETNDAGAWLGKAVAGAGDVNGDGYADVIVGAPLSGADDHGTAYLYLGGAGGLTTGFAWFVTGHALSKCGSSLTRLGDVNHDGKSDVAIGEPQFGPSGPLADAGGVRLFLGDAALLLTEPLPELAGVQAGSQYGTALGAGDFNDDTFPDLAAGAPYYNAPLNDAGRVTVTFALTGQAPTTTARVFVMSGADTVARGNLNLAGGTNEYRVAVDRTFALGEALDFEADHGGDGTLADAIGLDVEALNPLAVSGPLGAAAEFAGQRFAVAIGPQAFDNVAFDPVNRRLAGQTKIRDLCNNEISDGPPGQVGLTWDPRTLSYLSLDPDGNGNFLARHYDTSGVLIDTMFTLPPTFTVPGIGPDTLDSPRGMAADSNFIYLVDAGPNNVDPFQNEWFKLTRAGVPVAGRKGANFSVNAVNDVVDDVVYAPFSSPLTPGRLLVPIEHTGIYVLDTQGALVSAMTWAGTPGSTSFRPFAFAGLTLDPTLGDLFLINNDTGRTQVWTRLPDAGQSRYVLGVGGDRVFQRWPDPGCNYAHPLGADAACPPLGHLVFGIAYRDADARVYGIDYASGELWRMAPLSGVVERVAPTGREGVWGLAYDRVRDVFYGFDQATPRIVKLPGSGGAATDLALISPYYVDDLAFVPETGAIYGVGFVGSGSELIRFDRDTGEATSIGPTVSARGLDYDPVSGMLIASTCCSDTLWAIDPASGAVTFFAKAASGGGWEGLAVVPVLPAPGVDAPPAAPRAARLALTLGPNPTRGTASLFFALPERAEVEARVFDVAGRVVRRLPGGVLAPGEHVLTWDGRGSSGDLARPGVYFVRLQAGAMTLGSRLVRIE